MEHVAKPWQELAELAGSECQRGRGLEPCRAQEIRAMLQGVAELLEAVDCTSGRGAAAGSPACEPKLRSLLRQVAKPLRLYHNCLEASRAGSEAAVLAALSEAGCAVASSRSQTTPHTPSAAFRDPRASQLPARAPQQLVCSPLLRPPQSRCP